MLPGFILIPFRVMVGRGAAGGPGNEADQSPGRSWGIYSDMPDMAAIARRIGRSATTALLLSPVGLVVVSVVRLLIISDFNTTTASAVASSGGYVDTVLGTVISLVPIFMPYLALVLLLFNRVLLGALTLLAVAVAVPMAISRSTAIDIARRDWHAILFAHLLITTCVMGGLAAVVAFLLFTELAGVGIGNFIRTMAVISCIVLLPYISQLYPFPLGDKFYTQLLRQPWLPAEAMILNSGQVLVGYALSDDGNWIVVLTGTTRTIVYYPASEVIKRQVCQIGQTAAMPPLVPLFAPGGSAAASRTPPCPQPSEIPAPELPEGNSTTPGQGPPGG
jgi:hypothetical protein